MAMLMLEAVSNDGEVLVEVFVGVEKVRETWGSGMIIGEIFCFFAYIISPIFLLFLVWWSGPQLYESGKG